MSTIDSSLPGLSLLFKGEHAWLRFAAGDGYHCDINLNALAHDMGEVRGDAMRRWIDERRREAAAAGGWPASYEADRGR